MFVLVISLFMVHLTITSSTDLHLACKAGDLAKVKALVEDGADVNELDDKGNPAIASAFFWKDITQYLIDKGADPNLGKYPALISAANNYSLDVMKILLKAGADPNKMGETDNSDALERMRKAGVPESVIKNIPKQIIKLNILHNVINQTNSLDALKLLVEAGADLKAAKGADGTNLIFSLIAFGKLPQERIDIWKQGMPIMENDYGLKLPDWMKNMTLEMNADPVTILDYLVEQGLDIHQVQPEAETSTLMAAIGLQKPYLAKALIRHGVDVNKPNSLNKYPISQAAELGDTELLKIMIDKGVDVNIESFEYDKMTKQFAKGFTPLTMAAMKNQTAAVDFLLKNGADPSNAVYGTQVNLKTNCFYEIENKTAIFFAIENNNKDMVDKLLANYEDWSNPMVIKERERELKIGPLVITSCLDDYDGYSPSKYAEALELEDLQEYLESKEL